MISRYLERAIAHADIEELANGQFFAVIKNCPGLWASGTSQDQCKAELTETLEAWLIEKLQHGDDIPPIDGITPCNQTRQFMRKGDRTIALPVADSDEYLIDEFILERVLRIAGIDENEWEALGEASNPNSH